MNQVQKNQWCALDSLFSRHVIESPELGTSTKVTTHQETINICSLQWKRETKQVEFSQGTWKFTWWWFVLNSSERRTCEEVSDLSDETSQLLVALLQFLFGLVGLHQDILSTLLCLVCFQFGFKNLKKTTQVRTSTCTQISRPQKQHRPGLLRKQHRPGHIRLTILESFSTSSMALMISCSESRAFLQVLLAAVTTPSHPSPPHLVWPSESTQPRPPQGEDKHKSWPKDGLPHVCENQKRPENEIII